MKSLITKVTTALNIENRAWPTILTTRESRCRENRPKNYGNRGADSDARDDS